MWVRPTETEHTFERLRRIVEVPLFRFVIIQALPQPDVFRDISDFLKKTFPERPRKEVNLLKTDYWALLKEFDEAQEGFVLLRNFEHLLHEPDLYVGFNQRRDRFASKPLTIIALLPTGIEVMRLLQDRIPDFWSLRAGTLEFRYRYLPEIKTYYQPRFRNPEPDTRTVEDKKQTLDELSQRLADLQADAQNIDAIVSASSELTLLCKDLGRPTDALHYTNIGLTLVNSSSLVSEQYYALSFLLLKADTLIEQGAFEAVEPVLAEAENLALKLEDRPLWYEAQYLRALRLLEKLQADDALDFLEQVLRQADEEPIALEINTLVKLQTLHGLAHIQSGEWDTAYRLLNQYVNEAKEKYLSKHIGAILFGTKNVAEVLRYFGDSVFILKGGVYSLT